MRQPRAVERLNKWRFWTEKKSPCFLKSLFPKVPSHVSRVAAVTTCYNPQPTGPNWSKCPCCRISTASCHPTPSSPPTAALRQSRSPLQELPKRRSEKALPASLLSLPGEAMRKCRCFQFPSGSTNRKMDQPV